MPVYDVVIAHKVTKKIDAAGNEQATVERVLVNKTGVLALGRENAAAIAGADIPKDFDRELLSNLTVSVTTKENK